LEEKSKGITRNITKLLIIDSLTDLYKLELNSEKKERNVRLNYQLNQILATLTYLARVYDITIIVVNETSRKKIKDEFILFPSGGNVVDYWVRFSILIKRFDKLNARIFFLKIKDDNQEFQFTLNLTKRGFFK
jgi:RecA/RadA recombinase